MGPMRQVRQQGKSKTGAKRGRPVDCTVRTGCNAMTKVGVVEPNGQVCRKETRKVVERNKTCWLQSQEGGQCRWTVGAAVPRKKVRTSCSGE